MVINSGGIAMTYPRIQATACLLISLHWKGGGETGGAVRLCT